MNIVYGISANKFDLFDKGQVKEEEGKKFAGEIGAVFQNTSAKNNAGIDKLFEDIGDKILQLINQSVTFDETIYKTKISDYSTKKKKKCC